MSHTFDSEVKHIQARFDEEIKKLRTGRAHISLVSDIAVEAYGARTPLAGLANISVTDAKTIAIEPWDASLVKDIEKAILASEINASSAIDGKIIRIHLPDLTQESRMQMVKTLKEKLEDARVAIRRIREEEKRRTEKEEKNGSLTEDDRHDAIKTLDEKTRAAVGILEERSGAKEKEITTI